MKKKELKFIPYGSHQVNQKDIDNVVDVLKNKKLTQGETLKKFERAIQKKIKVKYCVAVNSATSALHLSCLALGLKSGDSLWTSPNSFVASANCGAYCDAQIDFVDIDSDTGLMSISKLKKKLEIAKTKGKLPKIIVPVHLAGTSCDMQALFSLSKEYSFSIIEDASHAIGAKYKNEYVGNCSFSDMTVFSFHPVKIITTGEGGCVVTNNKKLFDSLFTLRTHGITKSKSDFLFPPLGDWSYEQQNLGFNYRLSDIHAALGLSQLERLDEIVKERNRKLNFYKDILKDLPLNFLRIPDDVYSSVHLAIIRLNNKDPFFHKLVFDSLTKSGLGVQIHYIPIHLQPYYRNRGFSEGDFPESELYSRNAISLPLYVGLSDKDQFRIAETLEKIF